MRILLLATLAIVPLKPCWGEIIFDQSSRQQLPATSIAQPSTLHGEAYDDFILSSPSIVTGMRIWTLEAGIRYGPFEYYIHKDSGGLPELEPLYSGDAQSLVSVPTGLSAQIPSQGEEIVNTFQLENPVLLEANTTYWLGLTQRVVGSSEPTRWEKSTPRVGATMQRALVGGWKTLPDRDAALQILGHVVPEPSSLLALSSLCLTGLAFGVWRRNKRR